MLEIRQAIEIIRSKRLSMGWIANELGVSRQAVFLWYNGGPITPGNMLNLMRLTALVAKGLEWKQSI